MYQLETQIAINAFAERVWSVLMDFPSHARWNPFIRSIEGMQVAGQSLKVFIQPPGASGMRFQPKVLEVKSEREFRWKGKLCRFDVARYASYAQCERDYEISNWPTTLWRT